MTTPQTRQSKLAKELDFKNPVYFKREDLNPFGSHKGRSIPLMIETYIKKGWRIFAISSSGNAALAAALYIKKYNQKHKNKVVLQIFVGEHIETKKLSGLKKLLDKYITLEKCTNPKQTAFQMEKNNEAKNLRQSTDDSALIGYESLATELSKIKNLSAVFIPTSSGTTAEGLYYGFKKLKLKPQIHIAQTPACHPMVAGFETGKSLATAIVDKVAHRKEEISSILKNSHGKGYIINDQQIIAAIKLAKKTSKITLSSNSALSVAALTEALKQKTKFNGAVVCLITGA